MTQVWGGRRGKEEDMKISEWVMKQSETRNGLMALGVWIIKLPEVNEMKGEKADELQRERGWKKKWERRWKGEIENGRENEISMNEN